MSNLSVADVLERAADLIEPEGAWTQGAGARDREGFALPESNVVDACCWCIGGALYHNERKDVLFQPAWTFLQKMIGDPVRWNDRPCRTQAEVVAKLREAADLARKEGK